MWLNPVASFSIFDCSDRPLQQNLRGISVDGDHRPSNPYRQFRNELFSLLLTFGDELRKHWARFCYGRFSYQTLPIVIAVFRDAVAFAVVFNREPTFLPGVDDLSPLAETYLSCQPSCRVSVKNW